MSGPDCTCDECAPPSLAARIERRLANPIVDTCLALVAAFGIFLVIMGISQ